MLTWGRRDDGGTCSVCGRAGGGGGRMGAGSHNSDHVRPIMCGQSGSIALLTWHRQTPVGVRPQRNGSVAILACFRGTAASSLRPRRFFVAAIRVVVALNFKVRGPCIRVGANGCRKQHPRHTIAQTWVKRLCYVVCGLGASTHMIGPR